MGNVWVVKVWVLPPLSETYCYQELWRGDDLVEAMQEMSKAKESGGRCICLEWRP